MENGKHSGNDEEWGRGCKKTVLYVNESFFNLLFGNISALAKN